MQITTSKGKMSCEEALERYRQALREKQYPFLVSVFRNLRVAPHLQRTAARMVLEDFQFDTMRYYSSRGLTRLLIEVRKYEERKEGKKKLLLTLRNSGRHLYGSTTSGYTHEFLRFKTYCGNGAYFGSVHLQHLGHLYGINGGPARVILSVHGAQWDLTCQPVSRYMLFSENHTLTLVRQ